MKNNKKSHLAVAPIIATLLMVAVAVVGGILIFVFTQGFFSDQQVTGTQVDSLYVSGYNAKDGTSEDLTSTGGTPLACPNASLDGVLSSGDCLLLFVQNRGPDPLSIGEVRVYGTSYSPSTNTTLDNSPADGPICDDGKVAGGSTVDDAEFRVYDQNANLDLIVEPNESSSICLTYFGNDVKPGKVIPVQIITENGQILLENVRNGAKRTSETGTFTALGGLTVPTEPPLLSYAAVNTGADNRIDITWQAVDDQGSPTTYTLTKTAGTGAGVKVSSTSTFSYNDDTICTESNTYTLTTANSAGSGPSGGSTISDTGITPSHTGLNLAADNPVDGDGSIQVTWVEGIGNADINCPLTIEVTTSGAVTSTLTTSDAAQPLATGAIYGDGDSYTVTYTTTVTDGGTGPVASSSGPFTYDRNCTDSDSPSTLNGSDVGGTGTNFTFDWSHLNIVDGCDDAADISYVVTYQIDGASDTALGSVSLPTTIVSGVNVCAVAGSGGPYAITFKVVATYEDGTDDSGFISDSTNITCA